MPLLHQGVHPTWKIGIVAFRVALGKTINALKTNKQTKNKKKLKYLQVLGKINQQGGNSKSVWIDFSMSHSQSMHCLQ